MVGKLLVHIVTFEQITNHLRKRVRLTLQRWIFRLFNGLLFSNVSFFLSLGSHKEGFDWFSHRLLLVIFWLKLILQVLYGRPSDLSTWLGCLVESLVVSYVLHWTTKSWLVPDHILLSNTWLWLRKLIILNRNKARTKALRVLRHVLSFIISRCPLKVRYRHKRPLMVLTSVHFG